MRPIPYENPTVEGGPYCVLDEAREDGTWRSWHWVLPPVTPHPSNVVVSWMACSGPTCGAMRASTSTESTFPGGPQNTEIHLEVVDQLNNIHQLSHGSCPSGVPE